MTTTTTTDRPATLAELKQALPTADADFLLSQLEAGATLQAATMAFAHHQAARVQQLQRDLAERDRRLADAHTTGRPVRLPGVRPMQDHDANDLDGPARFVDPVGEFDHKVRAKMAAGMPRMNAVKAVASANPELHRAFLMETNPSVRARRLIAEKYDQED